MNRTRLIAHALVACALGLAAFPGLASAATAGPSPDNGFDLLFRDGGTEANRLTISETASAFVFEDSGAPLSTAAPCTQETPNRVSCPKDLGSGYTWNSTPEVDLGGGGDELTVATSSTFEANGGAGNDTLRGGDAQDLLHGGDGDDMVRGGGGRDLLTPGLGNDNVDGGADDDSLYAHDRSAPDPFGYADADTLNGGSGVDIVLYTGRDEGVGASADGVANDGLWEERDNIGTDVEEIGGGDGDDGLVASGATTSVFGDRGRDQIYGSPGDDQLSGGEDFDSISGEGGDDVLWGQGGGDSLYGGSGRDRILGGEGDDRIDSRDAPEGFLVFDLQYLDSVYCEDGEDVWNADYSDAAALVPSSHECEHIDAPAEPERGSGTPPPPPVTQPTTPPATPTPKLAAKAATGRGKTVALAIQCPASAATDCKGRVRLLSGKKVLADGTVSVKKGRKGQAKLKLTSAGRKLRKKRAVKVMVVVIPAGAKVQTTLGTLKLTVR